MSLDWLGWDSLPPIDQAYGAFGAMVGFLVWVALELGRRTVLALFGGLRLRRAKRKKTRARRKGRR